MVPMSEDALWAIRICIAIMMIGCCLLLAWGGGAEDAVTKTGRDLDREHMLGAHSQVRQWGCKRCYPKG